MANIIYINDLRANRDPNFIRTPIGYVANDSTSRPILGLGDKLQLDVPPQTAGEFGNIRASIEGSDEFSSLDGLEWYVVLEWFGYEGEEYEQKRQFIRMLKKTKEAQALRP
jgi:hypothetical protein